MKTAAAAFILIPFFLFACTTTVSSQDTAGHPNRHFFWLSAGLGPTTVGGGLGGNFNATYQFGRHMLSLRMTGGGELFEEEVADYGLLYGYAVSSSRLLFSFGSGISVVSGSKDGGLNLFEEEESVDIGPTIGIPFEVHLCWRAFRFLGTGLYGFANVNPEKSFAGISLNLQVGKVR